MLADLYVEHTFWFWLAVAAGVLAIEVATGSGWLLWTSASAAVVAFLSLVSTSAAFEIGAFAVLTLASTLLARRFWPKRPLEADINDNVARLVGHRGKAVEAFAGGLGRVFIDGKEWAAELDDGAGLGSGDDVVVTGVSGARLKVRAT